MYGLGYGLALWQPAPLNYYPKIQIGDVGYLRDGQFHLLFSAGCPLNDREPGLDVPEDFVQLDVGPIISLQPRDEGALPTKTVEIIGGGASAALTIPGMSSGSLKFDFESKSNEGAILITKDKTYRYNAQRLGNFKNYILANFKSWEVFANRHGHGITTSELILVTGVDMAKEFAMTAFSQTTSRVSLSFKAGTHGASASASGWGSWHCDHPVFKNWGPQELYPEAVPVPAQMANDSMSDAHARHKHCVFVRAYRVYHKYVIIPKIKAAAGPHDLGPGPSDGSDQDLAVLSSSDVDTSSEASSSARSDSARSVTSAFLSSPSKFEDPLQCVAKYIFEHSISEIALLHDNDYIEIMTASHTGPMELKTLDSCLSAVQPTIHIFRGVGELTPTSNAAIVRDQQTRHRIGSAPGSWSASKTATLDHSLLLHPLHLGSPDISEPSSLTPRLRGLSSHRNNTAFEPNESLRPSPRSAEARSLTLEDDSDDESGGTIWAKKPDKLGQASQTPWQELPKPIYGRRPVLSSINTDNSFPSGPGPVPVASGDNDSNNTWALRPSPHEVFNNLRDYFPEHDVDKPAIEAASDSTSPKLAKSTYLIPLPDNERRIVHNKFIRVAAAEHKQQVDRTPRMEPAVQASVRKRNTTLWGSRLEEITSEKANEDMTSLSTPAEASPGGDAKPIFRWVRGELIGEGTYGKVFLALNATAGEMIAVKQVERPQTASNKDDDRRASVVQTLKLESETLKDLDHPNIVQYLGFEETPTLFSIFLEYVPGGSIGSFLRKYGKFDDEVTKFFTSQILNGLEYLHSKGILHRDLKADQILVEKSGICKISDFGLSKLTEDINTAGAHTSMQGTVFWMAPEVINSQKKNYSAKIDIWSVGCVVYEMWTGQRPWNGQEAMAVLLHLYQENQAPPVPGDVTISPLADAFRRQCFTMDPDERPSAAELQQHPYLVLQQDWTFTAFE
ncbi:hypothetical protein EIP91_001238 [Steccherinum ochraceum]|uniref:Protein kinase domain-containing protein n=1 Tax=Steccherinum ochraceum TaxID=92696 RepID=A0A4R0REE6_9APHY|nr:hypothetical protein EIP91_001238 [Steccherinum ochraceum]